MKNAVLTSLAVAALALPGLSLGADSPWTLRVGAHNVDPKSETQTAAGPIGADPAASLTLNVDYAITESLTIDLLAAYPFEHDLTSGGTTIGSTKHLPPTLSLQYRLVNGSDFTPYVAAGVNYTTFFDEELDGTDVELDLEDSFGLAGQLGVDYSFDAHWLLGVDVRYIQIETDVSVGGADIGSVTLDPWVYGANVGYRF